MRFYHLLRAGITWKGPEVIELWYKLSDMDKSESKDDVSVLCDIEEESEENLDDNNHDEFIDDPEKSAASGSDEDDSLLVAYDSNSIGSVWQKIVKIFKWFGLYYPNHTEIYIIVIFFIEVYAQIVSLM